MPGERGCAKMLPAHDRTFDTVASHVLLSFVASFLHVMVKNHMGVLDARYVAVLKAPAACLTVTGGESVEVTRSDGRRRRMWSSVFYGPLVKHCHDVDVVVVVLVLNDCRHGNATLHAVVHYAERGTNRCWRNWLPGGPL